MSNNTNYGLGSLQKNSGTNNTAIGAYAAYNNLDSSNNTALGSNSAFFNTTGSNNTSMGAGSMCNNTTGSLNTAVGSSALEGPAGSVGNQNTAIGAQSLYTNQGSLNTAIGTYSALGVTGGNYNTFLGANSSTLNDANYNYSTAIGYNAKIDDSNQIMMGGTGPAGYPNIIIPGNAYLPNFTTATSETQLVPKSYVDLIGGGLKPTQACICATTADINLSLNTAIDPSSTDGFDLSTLTDGSYNILVVNQDGSSNTLTSSVENGVYILNKIGSTYTWGRPPSDQPMSVGKSATGAFSFVKYGNTYARTALVQINDPAIVGTDELQYQVVYQLGVEPGQGLNSTTVGTNTYINVDSSLNFINFLDSTSGVTNATGTLSLGTKSTSTIIGNLNQMSTTTSGYKIDTLDRINQQLGSDPSYNAVNGYYGLAKDAYPALNPYSSGVKAVSSWTARTTNNNNWASVTWAPELRLFAAVASNGSVTNAAMTSPDGINWTTTTTNTNQWRRVIWAAELGLFVATAVGSGVTNKVMYSSNGTTWTATSSGVLDQEWYGLCWSPELRLLVAVSRTGSTQRVMTSTNAINWTARNSPTTAQWINVVWAAELSLFVACGITGIMTSSNGIDWTTQTLTAPNNSRSWVNINWSSTLGLFVAVAQEGATNVIMTSPDAINWTNRTSPVSQSLYDVVWASELELFVIVGNTGTILSSPDGINWSSRTSPNTNQWFGLTWAPELGLLSAVSITGSSNRAMTSSLAGRPPTSYNVFDSSFNRIDPSGNWTFGITEVSTNLGASPTASFGVRDNTNNNSAILFLPNCTQGNYNPGIKANDKVIVTTGASKDLFITENDSVNVGVRIASSGATLGYGGTTNGSVPNNRVICDASGVNISTPNSSIFCSGSTANVGIGTTSPSYNLDVNGNIKGSYLYLPGQAVAMNSLTSQGTYINWNSDGGSGYTDLVSSRGGSSLGGFRFYYQNPGSRPPIIQNYNNPIFQIDISGNTLTPGSAAIGKTTVPPSATLDVSGNALISGTLNITAINTPLVQNSGGTIEINGSQINLDATTIDFQNTSTTTSTSNFTANIGTTSSGVSTTNFLKCKLNGADIWIPYFTTDPSV